MTKQAKLTEGERYEIDKAISGIVNMPKWSDTAGGSNWWRSVIDELTSMLANNTTDGKPWVEPEPEVMWTTPDAIKECKTAEPSRTTAASIVCDALRDIAIKAIDAKAVIEKLAKERDNCAKDVGNHSVKPEPAPDVVIDDKWAAVWPRRLVMVRDDERKGWEGPYHLGCVCTRDTEHPFSTVEGEIYSQCRPCTSDEIAAYESANGKQEQPAEPEIGEGYRVATEADQYREDRDIVLGSQWMKAIKGVFVENARYRVPVDRIPTDEDARSRPLVMVRDDDGSKWFPRVLLAVCDNSRPFVVVSNGLPTEWKQCRFPYPGEVSE